MELSPRPTRPCAVLLGEPLTGTTELEPCAVHQQVYRLAARSWSRHLQCLAPSADGLGARSLNIELQNALNPPGEIRVERFGWTFCPGDKVMQIENDYDKEVYNGDVGIVSSIDMEESELTADFEGREVVYGFAELDELVLAYATTIHKSQGSEYPPWSFR
jgi:exodeoxyribonuclease V alpha subunit